jgi:hypothetical protein
MHVAFVEPCFPSNQREFLRGLLSTGARVSAISERPAEALPRELREGGGHGRVDGVSAARQDLAPHLRGEVMAAHHQALARGRGEAAALGQERRSGGRE